MGFASIRDGAAVFVALALAASPAAAQDVNGVPNADVAPRYSSVSVRTLYAPASNGHPSSVAAFAQYQRNFGERWSLNGGVAFGARGGDELEFRAAQIGAQWQFAESETAGGDGALLLIARVPDGNEGPARVAAILAGKWIWREDYEIRAGLASSVEFGLNARDGVGIGFRGEATRRIGRFSRIGVQVIDGFNTTAKFGPLRTQSHQAGLVFKRPFGKLQLTTSALGGLTDAAPDIEFKLFLTYEL